MQRYFAKEKAQNAFILGADDIHHIKTVMRMKDGANIYVVYDNVTYICEISFNASDLVISIIDRLEATKVTTPEICLYIPLLKEQKMDLVLQKATELGVTEIIPIITERSIVKIDASKEEKKLNRWRRICKEASEQSHRNTIPKLDKIVTLHQINTPEGLNLLCSTREKEKSVKTLLQNTIEYDKINVVVGPEGGLANKEEDYLIELGFIPVTLGPRILRVETVPLFLLSIINYEYME